MAIGAREAIRRRLKARPERLRGDSCLNCEVSLDTQYCPDCGQENVHGGHSVSALAGDFLAEFAYYDAKVWLTLRMLFVHPGSLSVEWARGRRARYVSPIKLYLWITFVFFLAISLRAPTVKVQSTGSPARTSVGTVGRGHRAVWIDSLARSINAAVPAERHELTDAFKAQLPKVLFVILPLLALALKLLYWRQRKYYVESLVFVLHLHACYFCVLLLAMLLPPATERISRVHSIVDDIIVGLLVAWMMAYTFVALIRFYEQNWRVTALKSAALTCVYAALISLGVLIALVLAIESVPASTPKPLPAGNQGSRPL